jgi:glucosamine-6-phosphate deaminase
MTMQRLAFERLSVEVHSSRASLGLAAGDLVARFLREEVARSGRAAAIFASAPSQNEFLAALRADTRIEWPRITAFHLDEYVGVSDSHPASFRRFLRDRLFDHVRVGTFHGLDGQATDLDAECARYAALLEAEQPFLAILGVGENAHLAFIDPPVCDFADPFDVRVVELDAVCRQQQVNDGAFSRIEEVPRNALSLTVPRLMRVPRAVVIVPGPAKRKAIRAALQGPIVPSCPASILRRHESATLFLDVESAALLDAAGGPPPASTPF